MAGARGGALEWALALLHAPGERHALRKLPLPDGVDLVLSIASGGRSAALAEAVAETGHDEATLREAARFYAREILFYPQADAYRMLGVPPDAPAEVIRGHHRLLQQWLHPDRQQSEDDAVFAARINTAWNQLRTQPLRDAYDASLRDANVQVGGAAPARNAVGWIATPMDVPSEPPRWQRWPAMVFGIACLVLVALVLVEADRPPPSVALDAGEETVDEAGEDAGFNFSVPVLRKAVAAIKRSAAPPARDPPPVLPATATRLPEQTPVKGPTAVPELPAAGTTKAEAALADVPAEQAEPDPVRPSPEIAQADPPSARAVDPPPPSRPALQAKAPASVVAAAPAVPAIDAPDPARVRSARLVGMQLIDFVTARRRAPPPIWNNPSAQAQAAQAATSLQARGRVRAGEPDWRVGKDTAEVSVRFEASGAPAGTVRAKLAWRAEQWLVTRVDTELPQ